MRHPITRGPEAPTLKALEALDAVRQESLERDLIDLIDRYNSSGDDGGIVGLPGSGDDQKATYDNSRSTKGKQNALFMAMEQHPAS